MSLQLAPGSKRPWAAITQAQSEAATSVLGGTRAAAHGHSFPILPSPAPCRASIFFAFGLVRYNARPTTSNYSSNSITTPFLFTLHSKFKIY